MRFEAASLYLATLSIVFVPETGNAADSCPPLTRITSVDTTTGPGGYMLVPMKFGDAERLMLFDTGGAVSSITAAAAAELHIPTYDSNVRIATVAGKVSDRMAVIPSITIGTLEQKRAQYMVLPAAMPTGISGLLAPAPGVDIDLDFAGHKLAFFSPKHCEGKVVYWQAPAVAVVPMRVAGLKPGALSTEHIIIPVNLDGKSVDATIDSGSTVNVLKLSVAQDRFSVNLTAPDVTETGHFGNNLSDKTYRKRFGTLSFEGVTVTNPEMQLIPDKQSGAFGNQRQIGSLTRPSDTGLPDLIIGMPILSKLHMYVAYEERKVYITAADTPPTGVQNASVSAPAAPALQIGGSWQVASPVVTPACEITQNGGELTGTCSQPQAKGELTGVVAGQAIRWQWKATANSNGNVSLWNFSGTMSKDTMIVGYVELNGHQTPFFATSLSSSASTPEVAGSWKIASPIGVPLCSIAQNGDKLTGTCMGPQATGELTGTVTGESIRWQWKAAANSNGNVALLNFWGAMSTDKTITGFVISNGRAGSFTATKQ